LLGLTDRANQVSLKAQQVNAGANDTVCNFNLGGDTYFEWTIETSGSSFDAALSLIPAKNLDNFYNAISGVFRMRLNSLYANQIANVSFISRTALANSRYSLLFRVYFLKAITNTSLRTDIVSNIQSIYYEIIKTYFPSVSKTLTIPTSVKISVPNTINCAVGKAVLTSASGSVLSLLSNSQFNLSNVMSMISLSNYLNLFLLVSITIHLLYVYFRILR